MEQDALTSAGKAEPAAAGALGAAPARRVAGAGGAGPARLAVDRDARPPGRTAAGSGPPPGRRRRGCRRGARAGPQNQEALAGLQAKTGALEAKLAESQSQQAALDAMVQELTRNRDERLLAETEQALNIAAQQLQLAGNVEAALIALQGADARLAAAGRPSCCRCAR
jgi:hypothetical protein